MPELRDSQTASDGTRRIGRYELLTELAVGGMAKLYVARAKGLADFSKPVVLKRILAQYAADPTFVEMFLDEARLAATLHHPNIVNVYDIGQTDGEYFFTMEYIHGESLARVMQTVTNAGLRLPVEHAVSLAIGIAAGLDFAHKQLDDAGRPMRIVHRDIAPSNVLIGYSGAIKLVDFGIAKAATRHHTTEVGTLKGRIAYMSPEQSVGADIDSRSDIYSLGVVLYELLTNKRMYGKANQLAILHALGSAKEYRPSDLWDACPPELDRIVLRALAFDPEDRYQSAGEFQADLESFAHSHGLFLSSLRLAKFMSETFGDRPEPWNEDTALTQVHKSSDSVPEVSLDSGSEEPEISYATPDSTLATLEAPDGEPPSKGRGRLIAGIAALGLAAAAGIGLAFYIKDQPSENPPAATESAADQAELGSASSQQAGNSNKATPTDLAPGPTEPATPETAKPETEHDDTLPEPGATSESSSGNKEAKKAATKAKTRSKTRRPTKRPRTKETSKPEPKQPKPKNIDSPFLPE